MQPIDGPTHYQIHGQGSSPSAPFLPGSRLVGLAPFERVLALATLHLWEGLPTQAFFLRQARQPLKILLTAGS